MSITNSVVAIYDTHERAEHAVKQLQEAGMDMKSLSIAGKDMHTDEHVVGYYNAGDRMKYWIACLSTKWRLKQTTICSLFMAHRTR